MACELLQWVFHEFIPFGDLVSDVALVLSLPSEEDTGDLSLYRIMRWLLWVGTIVSAIPVIAPVVGIFTGVVIGTTLGPASRSTGENKGKTVLWSNIHQAATLSRYILSDSKTISRFILYLTKGVSWEWESAVTMATHCTFYVPLAGVTYPLVLCGKLRNSDGYAWYAPLILVQVVAGLMTEVSSIFFAISTRDTLSIVSAAFGLFCLVVSTLHVFLKGPKGATAEELSLPQRREEIVPAFGTGFRAAGSTLGDFLGIVVIGISFGLLSLPFMGVYFLETGEHDTGLIITIVGFVFFGLVLLCTCLVGYGDDDSEGAAVLIVFLVAFVLLGLGIVFALTAGFTAGVISLLSIGGGILLFAGCMAIAD